MADAGIADMTTLLKSALRSHKKKKPAERLQALVAAGVMTNGQLKKAKKRLAVKKAAGARKIKARSRG